MVKANTFYKLRNGTTVFVTDIIDSEYNDVYVVEGYFELNGKKQDLSWAKNGKFCLLKEKDKRDIVKELTKEEYPELYL